MSVLVLLPLAKIDKAKGFWRGNVPAEFLYVSYGAAQFTAYRTTAKFFDSCSLPAWLSSFLSGGTAGAAATAVTYPLDLLRTRFAAQGTSQVYTSVLGSIRSIFRDEGPRGFFRGLPVTIGQIAPYMGLFFSTYEAFRPLAAQLPLPFGSSDAVAGIMASTVSKTGVFPLDLLRRRMQVQGPFRKQFADGNVPEYERGVWRVAKTVVAQEGWRGLYKGLGISLVKAAPASAVTMWTYEHALKMIQDVS